MSALKPVVGVRAKFRNTLHKFALSSNMLTRTRPNMLQPFWASDGQSPAEA